MIKVYQEHKDGCFQAAIASILELPYNEIPFYNEEEMKNFYNEKGEMIDDPYGFQRYIDRINKDFLPALNLQIVSMVFYSDSQFIKGYMIREHKVIKGKYEGFYHALVIHNNEIVHDPSRIEGREFHAGDVYYIFQCLDPSLMKRGGVSKA